MNALVLTGSKDEIVEKILALQGEIREVRVFVEESSPAPAPEFDENIFAEMKPYEVEVGSVDDSREAIYTRREGE